MTKAAIFILIAVVSIAAHADIYRCRGGNGGGTVYQETPCNGGEKIAVPPRVGQDIESRIANAISLGRVMVGMTKMQAVRAWGKPDKINKTMAAGSESEQWVYRRDKIGNDQYLYFENGILRSIQGPG